METSQPSSHETRRSFLEARINEAPQLVVDCIRLARLLENSGDLKGAAAALQQAHFFLPNSRTILDGMDRLAGFHTPPGPLTISTALLIEVEDPAEAPREPEALMEDDLDLLIEGLGKARLNSDPQTESPPPDVSSPDDDELMATETLAQIYVAQKQFAEAIRVYDMLAENESNPTKARDLLQKAISLREHLRAPS